MHESPCRATAQAHGARYSCFESAVVERNGTPKRMSKTRNNHYIPRWYQAGFFEPGRTTYAYLDKTPDRTALADGRIVLGRERFESPTARCFWQKDLYSTFFGTSVNDEIERRLFGDIDGRGSQAVRAFIGTDMGGWHRYFQAFFEYIMPKNCGRPKGSTG